MSPRSALLSHTSLRTGPVSSHQNIDPNNAIVDTRGKRRKSRTKGSRRELALEVGRPSALSQLVDVDISRKDPRDEVMRLREILKTVEKHAIMEAKRATELQRANLEAQHRARILHENKLAAEQAADKANQEKRLYQFQLDTAQKEIERSQEAVRRIEKQRDEAEAEAARARDKARKLREEKLMLAAREEGRRMGFEAGFEHARAERQMHAARTKKPPIDPKPTHKRRSSMEPAPSVRVDKGKGKERAYSQQDNDSPPHDPPPNNTRRQNPPVRESIRGRDDDIISSPDSPVMSVSQLPLRNLPPTSRLSQAGPSQSSPLRPFKPPTETHSEPSEPSEPPVNHHRSPTPQKLQQQFQEQQQAPRPPSVRSTDIVTWSVTVPTPNEIVSNANESPHHNVATVPRDQWVTAQKRLDMPTPENMPPQLTLPPRDPPPNNQAKTMQKVVRLPLIQRASFKQAASWYRSLSLRKKAKPVTDPVNEKPPSKTVPTPTTTPMSAPLYNESQPHAAVDEPIASAEMYGQPPQPPISWYQANRPIAPPAASSVRSQDFAYGRRRRGSDAMSMSTRVSEFDLLSTPYIPAQSVKSGKEGVKRVKEPKDNYLGVIKEDPSSRGNTPSTDRYNHGAYPPVEQMQTIPQPNFGQPSLHQQPSYGTLASSVQGKRHSRRPPPPTITVPDPDEELEPFGVAYARHNRSQSMPSGYTGGADIGRRPSRISEKTTPDTSIVIDVVPPSGMAPDIVQSPPHTGVNHLSPYHVYRPPSQASQRMAAMKSVTSLHTQGGSRLEPPSASTPAEHPMSVADPRSKSSQSYTNYDQHQPQVPLRQPPTSSPAPSRAAGNQYAQDNSSNYTLQQQHEYLPQQTQVQSSRAHSRASGQYYRDQTPSQTPYQQQQFLPPSSQALPPQPRPESVRSYASRRPNESLRPKKSQSSFVLHNPDPDMSASPSQLPNNASGLHLEHPKMMQRQKSSTSLRSVGSYSKYDPTEYVDPAFWSANGPGELIQPHGAGTSIYNGQERRSKYSSSLRT
ncbi:hypothetical protein JR316_0002626 [Psilocybe cubensis]|uniref:Uncharacterized protein n=1 Tax=Psilocybe cubensis TaxID=181762 RepID=A0ACB8HD36_PSICU|nr:hypothetical protein JR316_0002626 [Psilocybe cubensis]KAH9485713.1 hypothetical protein JR316_0002626 [Psilocybe cubensis]